MGQSPKKCIRDIPTEKAVGTESTLQLLKMHFRLETLQNKNSFVIFTRHKRQSGL